MPQVSLARTAVAAALIAVSVETAYAQTAGIAGIIRDENHRPIKAATISTESAVTPGISVSATTDEKGRFAIIGLAPGFWTFRAHAPGFSPESGTMTVPTAGATVPPIVITLKKGPGAGTLPLPSGRDLQSELADADSAFNSGEWDEAIARYVALLAKAPALHVINLQIGNSYRSKKEYDKAIAAYGEVLKIDPDNDKAKIGIGMANFDKGDFRTAERTLVAAVESPAVTRDVFYSLGEMKANDGQPEESLQWYQKASEFDPDWGKPLFKLARLALDKGDHNGAATLFERVIAVDPASQEAAEAKVALERLRK